MTTRALCLAAAILLLGACQGAETEQETLAELDNRIAGNQTDPAVSDALQDQIAVDPALTQQSNNLAARRPQRPLQAQYPVPVRGAEVSGGEGEAAPCGTRFQYDKAWAARLPAAFPLPNGVTVTDAAGDNRGRCRHRAVTFATAAAPERVLAWYRGKAEAAGFSAEEQAREGDRILAGTKGEAAYYLIVTPRATGSDVALFANEGR
jgi:hypothetical protein